MTYKIIISTQLSDTKAIMVSAYPEIKNSAWTIFGTTHDNVNMGDTIVATRLVRYAS